MKKTSQRNPLTRFGRTKRGSENGPFRSRSVCKMSVGCFPLLQFNTDPKAIDANGDNGEKKPQNPFAEQLDCGTVKMAL